MRTVQRESKEIECDDELAEVAAEIAALFARRHMLAGFSVQDRATLTLDRRGVALGEDLCIADVAVHAWPDLFGTSALHDEIAQTIIHLLEAHPAAGGVLRGQTFARTFH